MADENPGPTFLQSVFGVVKDFFEPEQEEGVSRPEDRPRLYDSSRPLAYPNEMEIPKDM